ncbi:MAG: hypothetical protein KF764_16015 [Labilithrix sp.]|nr:hypothetical protein [Labilithrix sp.]MBX3221766.1 hypothetical protein [Labilithrix sp.]
MLTELQKRLHDDSLIAAMNEAATVDASPRAQIEMLLDLSMSLQQRPRYRTELEDAAVLAEQARDLAGADMPLLRARACLRLGTALKAVPGDVGVLHDARRALEEAVPALRAAGARDEEIADGEMNLGVVMQTLGAAEGVNLADALACYQRALTVFTRERYPAEFAMLQNNLATAFLAMPLSAERAQLREALAVQSFEEGLSVINLVDHPTEYAMLQNNLGNALQAITTSHPIENLVRAVEAYDEALKVRTPRDAPLEYANTIANKANALAGLPDDLDEPERPNAKNLRTAIALLEEADGIFTAHALAQQSEIVGVAIAELRQVLAAAELGGPEEPAAAREPGGATQDPAAVSQPEAE